MKTEQAKQDLSEIYGYISYELLSLKTAEKQLKHLQETIESLKLFPERHRLYDAEPWKSRNLRIMPVDHYCVFYIPDREQMTVTVIRVIYGGRDIGTLLNR